MYAIRSYYDIFRKEKKSRTYWKHRILEAKLAESVYVVRFCELLLPFYEQFLKARERRIRQFYQVDREFEQSRLMKAEHMDWEERLSWIETDLKNAEEELDRFFNSVEGQTDEIFYRNNFV